MKKNLILLLVLVTGLLYGQAPMQVLNEIDGTTMVCVTNLLPSLQVLENSVPFLTAHINDAAIHLTPEQAQRIEQSATTQELEQVTGDLHSHTSNAAIHLTPEQATKIAQSATTQELEQALSEIDFTEKDPAFWREYYYGDPNIYPSPTNWFTFAPVSGGWSCTGFSEEYNNTPDIVIPYEFMGQEVVRIGSGAFEGKNIKSVIGSKAIVAIGDAAFYECVSLASISLPQATHIGSTAFTLCVSLASISLPQATSIGSAAFSGCYLSTSISLPQATSIGSVAFSDCESLTNITFGSVAPTFAGSYHFYNTPETLTITITDPTATGYGDWIGDPPRRVVRPGLHTDELVLNGIRYTNLTTATETTGIVNNALATYTPPTPPAPTWQTESAINETSIVVTNTLLKIAGNGAVDLTLTGLTDGVPVYTVIYGADSLTINDAYWVGGPSYQSDQTNHYMIWTAGDVLFVNPITTTEL